MAVAKNKKKVGRPKGSKNYQNKELSAEQSKQIAEILNSSAERVRKEITTPPYIFKAMLGGDQEANKVLEELQAKYKNIFSEEDLSDLPPEVSGQIVAGMAGRFVKGSKYHRVYDLFSLQKNLTLNQIIIGAFRKYKMVFKRQEAYSLVNYLVIKKLVRRCGDGLFTKEDGENG